MQPALYLIPTTLGEVTAEETLRVIPPYNKEIVKEIKHFIVESRKIAVRSLKALCPEIDIDSLSFYELNEHTDLKSISDILAPLEKHNMPMGVLSDAGCPAVADPGAAAVKIAQVHNLKVVPLVGPSSILLSVMASGFNGQSFCFNGYLPVKDNERVSAIRKLENRAWNENATQLFIEAPYRNIKMFETILSTCRKETQLCVASGITTDSEFIKTKTVAEWKKLPVPEINKIPAIFLIYRG